MARDLAAPVAEGSFAPFLTSAGDDLLLTWIEPLEAEGAKGHRVRFARWTAGGWSEPSTIVEGPELFANWADVPGVVRGEDGALYAHWLAASGADKYAYTIFLGRSADGGATWEALGPLPDDASPTEHGFVSWVPEAGGARAFWLDGRQWVEDGPMSLRTALVGAGGVSVAERIDARVCDCCATDAAIVSGQPVVVYRDRSEEEIRDIYRLVPEGAGWSAPAPVATDGWRIEGCPVNGPRIAAAGGREGVAWFTAAGDEAVVRFSFAGRAPVRIDGGSPLGRVDLALAEGGAWIIWLEALGPSSPAWAGLDRAGLDRAEIRMRRADENGELGPWRTLAKTSSARASGFPRLERLGDRLILAWVDLGEAAAAPRVRVLDVGPA